MTTKKCNKCEEVKPLADYYKHRRSCKVCYKKMVSKYQETDEGREIKKRYAQSYVCTTDRKEYFAEYTRNKRATDINYRIADNLRTRLHTALNGNCKADTTEALLGCTYEYAVAHIEAQFTEEMSWSKMGVHGIHIDHIRPCASFDLTDPEQQRECFHYTNLQPLWAEDNLRKSDKW